DLILLIGYEPPRRQFSPGDEVSIPLHLYAMRDYNQERDQGYVFALSLLTHQGEQIGHADKVLWPYADRALFRGTEAPTLRGGRYLEHTLRMPLDPTLRTGVYQIDLVVFHTPSFALADVKHPDGSPVQRI